ncbi:MAG: hypothetical protein HY226_02830 [Candidatus Vogelbacteria bacterium]|nr:hypothetical protein [Candidatus Vogelbacteria bacterium]
MGRFADAPMIGVGYLLTEIASGKNVEIRAGSVFTGKADDTQSYYFNIYYTGAYHHVYARRDTLNLGQKLLGLLDKGGLEAARFPYFAEISVHAAGTIPESLLHYFDRRSAKMLFDAMEQAYKAQQSKEGEKR